MHKVKTNQTWGVYCFHHHVVDIYIYSNSAHLGRYAAVSSLLSLSPNNELRYVYTLSFPHRIYRRLSALPLSVFIDVWGWP